MWLLILLSSLGILINLDSVDGFSRALLTSQRIVGKDSHRQLSYASRQEDDDGLEIKHSQGKIDGFDFNWDLSAEVRDTDYQQNRDLDEILFERAKRFYDPKFIGVEKEKCILLAVDSKQDKRNEFLSKSLSFSFSESLSELSELVGTAGTVRNLTFHGLKCKKLHLIRSYGDGNLCSETIRP